MQMPEMTALSTAEPNGTSHAATTRSGVIMGRCRFTITAFPEVWTPAEGLKFLPVKGPKDLHIPYVGCARLPTVNRTLIAIAFALSATTAAAQAQDRANCVEAIAAQHPVYSPFATLARIQGVVKARFTVGQDGKAANVILEGHPILTIMVDMVTKKTEFASDCAGPLEVTFNFVLEGAPSLAPHAGVSLTAPGEYTVTSNPRYAYCLMPGVPRKSWLRRLLF
jgi:hypothetical protein